MKKFFLKGKEFINKKLEELQIATEEIDFVDEQIPQKLKKPFAVLRNADIDLEPNEKYYPYFKNHPSHHLSQFLFEKYQLLLSANTPSPEYSLPSNDSSVFVPNYCKEFENKALLLKEVVEEYDEGFTKVEDPIICLAVIQFHHKKGTQIEYVYPKNKTVEIIEDLMVHHAMPDSSHNKNEDYNFFNFEAVINDQKKMLFGVSYFKQIKVTQEMKLHDKELTRSFLQKAVAIVSPLPLFGYMKLRLSTTIKIFFQKFTNYEIINSAYKDISKHLFETWPQLAVNEVYIGSDLKTIANLFGASEFYQIWKAILLQKRVVVFAHSSSSASSFILSLLSLFPGLSFFGMYSKPIGKYMESLREYALPLKTFSSDNFMLMSFHIQDFHLLNSFQKSDKGSFLLGTTNRLLKETNDYGIEMLINLENCTIERKKSRTGWETQTKREKLFISQLQNIIETEKSTGYSGSQDMIRNHFHSFLKFELLQMIKGIQSFSKFEAECREYKTRSQAKKSPKSANREYSQFEQENDDAHEVVRKNDFPPLIPHEATSIPFASLLLCSSFSFFLQFHNRRLPEHIEDKVFPALLVENYEYYLKLNEEDFISYNWLDKKLIFGKGRPRNYEGKEIRYLSDNGEINRAKSIFIGAVQNNRYTKNCFYFDKNQTYEGDFIKGIKQGYGKLKNELYRYIGGFENDLCSGQGQMIEGKNIYVGEFKDGMKNGCGKSQGVINYEGEWVNNYPEGTGVLIVNGNQYFASFKKGKINQQLEVTIRYDDGEFYKGFVQNMQRDGRGYFIDQNGKNYIGIFKEGNFISELQTAKQITNSIQIETVEIKQEAVEVKEEDDPINMVKIEVQKKNGGASEAIND